MSANSKRISDTNRVNAGTLRINRCGEISTTCPNTIAVSVRLNVNKKPEL